MNKIVCYTCVTGGYDSLKEPSVVPDNIDFICFTDNMQLQSLVWSIKPIPDDLQFLSNVKKQRVVKICPHRYLSEYDISIWVDGNILIKDDLNKLLAEYDLDKVPFYTRIHPKRNCIYDEMEACWKLNKDKKETMQLQIDKYRSEGYPAHIGMAETNILLRKHNDRRCILLANLWASELLNHSHRDQLSFNYACWKQKFLPGYMTKNFKINNEMFEIYKHG